MAASEFCKSMSALIKSILRFLIFLDPLKQISADLNKAKEVHNNNNDNNNNNNNNNNTNNNNNNASEYMKVHIFELRRMIRRYDRSSQLYTQLKQ